MFRSEHHPVVAALTVILALLCSAQLLTHTAPAVPPGQPGPLAPQAALRFDPNTAPEADLALIPHLGPKRAHALVTYRSATTSSPFLTPADLERVKGIGPATARKISPFLTFSTPSP